MNFMARLIRTLLILAGVGGILYGIYTLVAFGLDPSMSGGGNVLYAGIGITLGAIVLIVLASVLIR